MSQDLTIFTPTYNRELLLKKCYESLCQQTAKNFVWLIIDDGSTDDTESLVRNWIANDKLSITYIKQANKGKHAAHNLGVSICQTPFFAILDSDDILDKNAVKNLEYPMTAIINDQRVSGIIGNWMPLDAGASVYKGIPKHIHLASGMQLYQKYNFKGETFRLYKADVLKEYPYPTIPGERFMPENVVFDKIDSRYKMLVLHSDLSYGEYQEDGLSRNSDQLKRENKIGLAISLNSTAKYSISYFEKIKYTLLHMIWVKEMGIQGPFSRPSNKTYYVLLWLPARLLTLFEYPPFIFRTIRGGSK